MERKFLEGLNIDKENIDKIMDENGKDIQREQDKAKTEIDAEKQKYSDLEKLLNDANQKIESFKDIDPDKLNKEIADWKEKAENAQKERDKIEQDSTAKDLLRKAGVSDDLSLNAILGEFNKKGLKYDNGTFIGAKEVIDGLKSLYPRHFESLEPNPNPGNPDDKKGNEGFGFGGNPPPPGKKDTRELLFGGK